MKEKFVLYGHPLLPCSRSIEVFNFQGLRCTNTVITTAMFVTRIRPGLNWLNQCRLNFQKSSSQSPDSFSFPRILLMVPWCWLRFLKLPGLARRMARLLSQYWRSASLFGGAVVRSDQNVWVSSPKIDLSKMIPKSIYFYKRTQKTLPG